MTKIAIEVQKEQDGSITSQVCGAVSQVWGFFKPAAKVTTILQLIQTADAVCFKVKANGYYGYDWYYRLNCINDEATRTVVGVISKTCPGFTDGYYCTWGFDEQIGFGSGLFGGSYCDLSFDYGRISDCVYEVVKNNSKNGVYGTFIDVVATIGIAIGGIVAISGLTYGSYRFFKCMRSVARENAQTAANERTRLINDDTGATAPSRIAPLPEDTEMAVLAPLK